VAQGLAYLALRQDMLRCGRTGSEAGSWVLAEGHEAEAGRRALVWAAEHRTALSSPASWYYYPSRVERGGGRHVILRQEGQLAGQAGPEVAPRHLVFL